MSTALKIYVNTGTVDDEYGVSGTTWTEMDLTNDKIIFTAGSSSVADGQPLPSSAQLNSAATLITNAEQVVAHTLLYDFSANLLKELHNAGNQNKRYVWAFSFDGATASEPVLEVWDDSSLTTIYNYSLGGDPVALTTSPTTSWVRGITTTSSAPGADWVGSRLAGDSDGHFLYLNDENGALTVADVLYCQMKIVVPASFETPRAEANVFAVKYTSN